MENKQIVKVNNPDFLQQSMWPLVVELADILKQPGVTAHSLMAYFLYGISGGVELWAAMKDDNCVGLISFQNLGAPHYSTGACTYFYMKEKDKELTDGMYQKFVDFLRHNKLKYYSFHAQNKKLGMHFKEVIKELGLSTTHNEYLYIGKRKIGD